MFKNCIQCFASLGAGIAMLISIGAGKGIGTATAAAIEGFSRNPPEIEIIIKSLIIGYIFILIPFFLAFIVALCLVNIASRTKCYDCWIDNCSKTPHKCINCVLATLGAGIAVLGGIGACLGIGIAASTATLIISRQPSLFDDIINILIAGSLLALVTALASFIVAILLLNIAKKKMKICKTHCD